MGKLYELTGTQIDEASEPFFKKMCLNCSFCSKNEKEVYSCSNKNVIEAGKKKILAAVPEGFEIATLELKPMLLKNPVKKCANYDANLELVHQIIDEYFVNEEKH